MSAKKVPVSAAVSESSSWRVRLRALGKDSPFFRYFFIRFWYSGVSAERKDPSFKTVQSFRFRFQKKERPHNRVRQEVRRHSGQRILRSRRHGLTAVRRQDPHHREVLSGCADAWNTGRCSPLYKISAQDNNDIIGSCKFSCFLYMISMSSVKRIIFRK